MNKVLVLGEFGVNNGGERSFLAILPGLSDLGWKFTAAVPTDSEFADALQATKTTLVDFQVRLADGTRKSQSAIRDELRTLIQRLKPDLIHCNSLSMSRLLGPVAVELQVPAIGHLRDILKLSKQAITDLNQLNALVAVSHATRDWHVAQGLDPHKSVVVYNGVDSEAFSPGAPQSSLHDELAIPPNASILLFVGQIGMRKGLDVLVECFVKLQQRFPELHLLIVGERNSKKAEAIEYEQKLRQTIVDNKLETQVHWLGRRTDVADIMRGANLLLHLARQEPLGRVLLEAFASGLVPVSTQVGGSPEIFLDLGTDTESGFNISQLLIDREDIDAAFDRVSFLLQNVKERQLLALKIREVAVERFPVARCVAQINGLYRRMTNLEKQPGSGPRAEANSKHPH